MSLILTYPLVEAATNRERKLRRELIEEDLSYVTVSNLTKLIQGKFINKMGTNNNNDSISCVDPTRLEESDLNEMQKEVHKNTLSFYLLNTHSWKDIREINVYCQDMLRTRNHKLSSVIRSIHFHFQRQS